MSVETITRDGLVYGMDETEYHGGPELSSTGVRAILDSPARFAYDRAHRTESRAFDVGHAAHARILGAGMGVVAYPPEHLTPMGNPSTKAATIAWAAEQRTAGLVPIAQADLDVVNAMAEAVLHHREARRLLEREHGAPEVSVFATDPDTGVHCRARFDFLSDLDRDIPAVDVKTTRGSASASGFGREAATRGYPIQQAHYVDTLQWATGCTVPFRFVVVEKAPPHLVAVHALPESALITAFDLAAQARRTVAECAATNTWPGYGDGVLTTEVPSWWFYQADEEVELKLS